MARPTPVTDISDDPGGEVITVEIRLNNKLIAIRSCTTVERIGASANFRYKVEDTGDIIVFQRRKGVIALAEVLLKRT